MLGRFAQADTIVPDPGNPQSLNRYSYVLNNALKYTDPTGHAYDAGGAAGPSCTDGSASYMACTYPESHPLAGYWIGTTQAEADAGWDKFVAGVEVVAGVLFEPADWAITGNHWRQGDFHVLDLAGLLPLVPASGVRALRHADEVVELTDNTILKRAFRTEQDRFLRKGEQGLSVHIGATDEQISEHLRGDIMTTTYRDVLDLGLNVDKTPGTIRELEPFHFEIVPGLSQTWNQFKNAIKNVPWRKQ